MSKITDGISKEFGIQREGNNVVGFSASYLPKKFNLNARDRFENTL